MLEIIKLDFITPLVYSSKTVDNSTGHTLQKIYNSK